MMKSKLWKIGKWFFLVLICIFVLAMIGFLLYHHYPRYSGQEGNVKWKITYDGKLIVKGICGKEQENGFENAGWLSNDYNYEVQKAYIELENAVNLSHLLDGCTPLTFLDISGTDTSMVTDMSYMLSGCAHLAEVNISHFDTSNVTDMSYMFEECESLVKLDVSGFDTANVTDMSYMFSRCDTLETLNLQNFNTSKVTNMAGMFQHCMGLKDLELSNFDTRLVTDMSKMFKGLTVSELDISMIDTENVTNIGGECFPIAQI